MLKLPCARPVAEPLFEDIVAGGVTDTDELVPLADHVMPSESTLSLLTSMIMASSSISVGLKSSRWITSA